MSRPTKWNPDYAPMVKKACELGATDEDLADMLGVCRRTINTWKVTIPEFSASLKVGKEVADDMVERSLYSRAIGYSHPEDKIFSSQDGPITIPTMKHYPPDATSAIFWLKNRRPEQWREKPEGEEGEEAPTLNININSAAPVGDVRVTRSND